MRTFELHWPIFTLFIILLVISPIAVANDVEPELFTYSMGQVPPNTVWHGNECTFLLDWPEHTEVLFSLATNPVPQGVMTLEPNSPGVLDVWRFSYTPAPQDKHPFVVTLTSIDGVETVRQSFEIVPMAPLPPEQVVFDSSEHSGTELLVIDDLVIDVTTSSVEKIMNYVEYFPRTLRIQGETVVFEAGHPNTLFDTYSGSNDIELMEIIAQTVIIRSGLHLPQTNVVINAEQLLFEGPSAQLSTSPVEKAGRPGTSGEGKHGLTAGPITLNIDSFSSTHPGQKFYLKGGNGQPGGYGAHGGNGASLSEGLTSHTFTVNNPWPFNDQTRTYTAPSGYLITYVVWYDTCAFGIPIKKGSRGSTSWPGNGDPATAPGRPGNGGQGGILSAPMDLSGYSNVQMGVAGATAIPQSWPFDRYKGGYAGWPRNSIQMKINYCTSPGYHELARHTSVDGTDQVLKYGSNGVNGSVTISASANQYAWLTVSLVDNLLHKARNEYLAGQIDTARLRMEYLHESIAAFRDDTAAWEARPSMERMELQAQHDQTQTYLHQIDSNLDYFGNPDGWVPMLSFEVNTTLFDTEIDRAIDMLYLAHWIGNVDATSTEKRDALKELRTHLEQEIDDAKEQYDSAVERLPGLKSRSSSLKTSTTNKIIELETLELQLENQAMKNKREPWWKTTLKTVALTCKSIPLLQPVIGQVGQWFGFAAEVDPDDPYGSLIKGTQLADSMLNETLDDVAAGVAVAISAATGNVGDAVETVMKEVSESKVGLTDFVEETAAIMTGVEAPAAEIQAELERLKEQSPEYKALAEEVEELQNTRGKLARDIIDTIKSMAGASDIVAESLLAMDALQEDLADLIVLDSRAIQYLEALERRSFDRLLKYHYYMAKAYEYRLLRPYEEQLNLDDLLEEISNSVIGSGDEVIPPDQFAALKGLYKDKIATIADTIFTDYQDNPPEVSSPIRFSLTQEELDRINAGEPVRLNLFEMGIFPSTEENIRIVDFKVIEIETTPLDGDYEENANLDLKIEHSGQSKLMSNGQTFLFRHYNKKTTNPITWGVRFFPFDNDVVPIKPSAASASLLRSLLKGDAISDMLLYSRPSAWADVEFFKDVFNNGGKGIDLTRLRLELIYDSIPRDASLSLADVRLMASKAQVSDEGQLSVAIGDFLPYFIVDTADFNLRQDAWGHVHRLYQGGGLLDVKVTSQNRYSQWKFNKWTDRFGNDLATGATISIVPDADKDVVAQYVPLATLPGDINNDCIVDMADFAMVSSSWMLVHPSWNLDDGDEIGSITTDDLNIVINNWLKTCQESIDEQITSQGAPLGAPMVDTGSSYFVPNHPRQLEYVY